MATHNSSPSQDTTYEEKASLKLGATAALQGVAAGIFVSTIQNALGTHSKGAWGVFTRSGSTVGLFGALAGSFAFTRAFVANKREVDDPLNGAAGGCAAGFLAGIRARSLPLAVGGCAFLGGAAGLFEGAGRLTGSGEPMEEKRKRFYKPSTPLGSEA